MEYLFVKPKFQVQNFRTNTVERIHFEIYYQENYSAKMGWEMNKAERKQGYFFSLRLSTSRVLVAVITWGKHCSEWASKVLVHQISSQTYKAWNMSQCYLFLVLLFSVSYRLLIQIMASAMWSWFQRERLAQWFVPQPEL